MRRSRMAHGDRANGSGRYVQRQLRAAGLDQIDTFMLTHLHADHPGRCSGRHAAVLRWKLQAHGGVGCGALVPIRRFVDRAWPDYSYPAPASLEFQKNYRSFLAAQAKAGRTAERFKVGSKTQFGLQRKAGDFPSFEIRNLIANARFGTGQGEQTRQLFPDLAGMKAADLPSENACSAGIRLRYGKVWVLHRRGT